MTKTATYLVIAHLYSKKGIFLPNSICFTTKKTKNASQISLEER
jgi:hypothetical protein